MEIISKYHVTHELIAEERDQIMEACKDPSKFEVLYKKYYQKILLFVYQRVDTKDDALDVTSQVFLKALVNLKRYTFKGVPFSAWLYRIALNELNTMFRHNKIQRALNIDTDCIDEITEEMDILTEEKENELDKLTQSLSALPDNELLMIEMRFFEKRPFREMGDILNMTENNAKVKVYRIIDKLKKSIMSYR
jgi:RNA polymerase sigma-70 factor (ECF subfamily)